MLQPAAGACPAVSRDALLEVSSQRDGTPRDHSPATSLHCPTIERRHNLSYDDFFVNYVRKGKPVILTDLTDDWPCMHEWRDEHGHPNLPLLKKRFGHLTGNVSHCSCTPVCHADTSVLCPCLFGTRHPTVEAAGCTEFAADTSQSNTSSSSEPLSPVCFDEVNWTFDHFLDACWPPGTNNTDSDGAPRQHRCGTDPVLYWKDWHCALLCDSLATPEMPPFYRLPHLLSDDWIHAYHMHKIACSPLEKNHIMEQTTLSDYRFVYIGAAGSWTPLHADVFRSYR
eukprot:TRINITY_DN2773_c0_g1_i1.p1 TRINITY_DN2773_c0_g1~~TRINITY_DN2773_c0_g1_i1.p1  ORF type:complete len:300 (+),score=18.90 TRINITY_DN2773_c0_g1_i1:54-902(+)